MRISRNNQGYEPRIYATTDGPNNVDGRLQFEPLHRAPQPDTYGIHYSIWQDTGHRKGMASAMADEAFRWAKEEGWTLVWVDDPNYRAWGGSGAHTPVGQAFADAYRQRRGMPLPPITFVYGRAVERVLA
jgi:hypothetical protein